MYQNYIILSLAFSLLLLAGIATVLALLAFSQRGRDIVRRLLSRRGRSTPQVKPAEETTAAHKPLALTRERLETVVVGGGMYLDPGLHIGDLLLPLGTNRTYLSNFINSVYGMNFRQYINSLRIKEMERLSGLRENRGKSAVEIIPLSGFGSYRSYLRAKNEKTPIPKTDKPAKQ